MLTPFIKFLTVAWVLAAVAIVVVINIFKPKD